MLPSQPNAPVPESLFSQRHLVETPEQVRLTFDIAGIGSRFLAILLDTLLQLLAAALVVILSVAAWFGFLHNWSIASPWLIAAGIVAAFLLYFGYFALFEIFWNGQTPGKRAIGIRVVRETGGPLPPAEAIARNLMRIIDQMPAFYALGVLVAICNAQSKRLGDFVAGSIVVRETPLAESAPRLLTTPAFPSHRELGGERLTPEEIHLVNAFLIRRSELSDDVRRRMGDDILVRLSPKLGLTDEDRHRREATLETLAYEHRTRG